jgi:hypothetical protein
LALQESTEWLYIWVRQDVKVAVVPAAAHGVLFMGSISWYIYGIPASVHMGFNVKVCSLLLRTIPAQISFQQAPYIQVLTAPGDRVPLWYKVHIYWAPFWSARL